MDRIAGETVLPEDGTPTGRSDREADRTVVVAARGGSVLFAGRLFTWVIRFGIAVVLGRVLGADGYGLYSLAISISTVAAILPTFGLDAALVRYTAIATRRGQAGQLRADLRFVVIASLALSTAVVAGVVLFSGTIAETILHDARLVPLLLIGALSIPSTALNRHLGAALQGLRRIEYAALAEQFAQPIVRLVLVGILLVVVGLTTANALVAWLAASFAATALLARLLWRALPPKQTIEAARPQVKELIRFSLPVFLTDIVASVGGNLQTLFLGAFSTVSAVGIFGVASQLNLIGSIFHSSIVSSAMALFADAQDRGDRRGLERLYQTVSKWSISLNLPLFLMIVFYPDALLALFGPDFNEGTAALVILAVANLAQSATGTSGAVLDMTGHTNVKLVNALLGLGLAFALNLALIPQLGLMGAAIAVVASTSAINVLRVVEVAVLLKTSPYNATFYKLLVAAAAAVVVTAGWKLIAVGFHPWLAAAIGIPLLLLSYVFVLVRLGLGQEDRLVLDRVRHRFLRNPRDKDAGN